MTDAPLDPVALIQEAFATVQQENMTLRESIEEVRAMMQYEDAGWKILGIMQGGDHLEGLDLSEVKEVAEKIAPKVAGSSLPRRAVDLHSGFVWGRGCYIESTEKPKGRGNIPATRRFFVKPSNQESVFSDSAHEELQKARFIDGNVLAAVNASTGTVNRIPFNQITGLKLDPDFPENIWAYKRTWDTKDGTANSVKSRWYYTKRFTGKKQGSITVDKVTTQVAPEIIVDLRANRQVGHVLGIPDGLAGYLWSETYGRILSYGETVQEGLAKIIFRVTNKTKQGTQSTGVKIANFGGHGGTASMADGQELNAVSTAGKGYDYASARPIAAMAAAAWNVSTMDLLNDSSAAGSSYGSAHALVGGNRNAMLLMQHEWADFYKDIFDVAGLGRPSIIFDPFESPDPYRAMQALTLGKIALDDEEFRMKVLDINDISGDPAAIPEAMKLAVDAARTAAQAGGGGQGVANGTGGGGSGANDQRSDTLTSQESLRREMANEEFLNRFESLIERFEATKRD
jgi:hypothetical protein